MSDTTTCSYCGCTLTMGRYEFTGHTDELCKALTLDRIRFTERALEDAKRDLTILRDMMGRHVCAPAAGEREEKRTVCSAPGCTDLADPRWFVHLPACDGHGELHPPRPAQDKEKELESARVEAHALLRSLSPSLAPHRDLGVVITQISNAVAGQRRPAQDAVREAAERLRQEREARRLGYSGTGQVETATEALLAALAKEGA